MEFFHACQTNSHAQIHLRVFSPFPPARPTMLDTCTSYFSRGSTLYGGVGGKTTHFETENSAFLKVRFKHTENYAITQVSQGILSTIVAAFASPHSLGLNLVRVAPHLTSTLSQESRLAQALTSKYLRYLSAWTIGVVYTWNWKSYSTLENTRTE